MKTLQETFNIIYAHLAKMNERSTEPHGLCVYRGCAGNKCAIGVLIHDKHYHVKLEREEPKNPLVLEAIKKSGYPTYPDALKMYGIIQYIHDSRFDVRLENMKVVAKDYGLNIPTAEN